MKHLDTSVRTTRAVRQRRAAAPVYDWIGAMIVALVVLVLLFVTVLRVVGVDGDSMVPTLHDRDRLLLSCVDRHYETGDIVVIDRYTREPIIKRVIAVAGDTVWIDEEQRLFVNGEQRREPYIQGANVPRDLTGRGAIIRKKAKKCACAALCGEKAGETAKKNCDLPDDVL